MSDTSKNSGLVDAAIIIAAVLGSIYFLDKLLKTDNLLGSKAKSIVETDEEVKCTNIIPVPVATEIDENDHNGDENLFPSDMLQETDATDEGNYPGPWGPLNANNPMFDVTPIYKR